MRNQGVVTARVRRAAIVVAATVLGLSACSNEPPASAPTFSTRSIAPTSATATSAAAPTSVPATSTVAPTPTKKPIPAATTTPPLYDGSLDEYFSFVTPSKNIRCAIYVSDADLKKGQVRCDVLSGTWKVPPKPADCEFDWQRVMKLETKASAGACVSDAIDIQGARTVAYGTGVRWKNITCVSEQSGLTCTNTTNRASFTVSRAHYKIT